MSHPHRTEYRVVECSDIVSLVQRVNEYIAEGWEPKGGVCVSYTETPDTIVVSYCQAMIRER